MLNKNIVILDLLASPEANWSGSTVFKRQDFSLEFVPKN